MGFPGKQLWYPADKLTIVDWQVVRGVPPVESDVMLEKATRSPKQNKSLIENYALEHLGINRNFQGDIYKVRPHMNDTTFQLTVSSHSE